MYCLVVGPLNTVSSYPGRHRDVRMAMGNKFLQAGKFLEDKSYDSVLFSGKFLEDKSYESVLFS